MATQLTQTGSVQAVSNALLIARTEELERLNTILNNSFQAAARDSEMLRQRSAVKDEVLGFVAHELRGPLTTILGNASILLSKGSLLGPSDVEVALQDIQTDAQRLQRLLANLLVLARPELATAEAAVPLDLSDLVQTSIAIQRKEKPSRQIVLTMTGPALFAAGSRDHTEEVIINLLSNAAKYSPAHEPIEVRLRGAGNYVEVSVLDRGPGIAIDEVQTIFQPFYRSQATATQALGLGLGLAVCKRLVEVQGGKIWVSPRPGGGSEFTFALPLASAHSLAASESPSIAIAAPAVEAAPVRLASDTMAGRALKITPPPTSPTRRLIVRRRLRSAGTGTQVCLVGGFNLRVAGRAAPELPGGSQRLLAFLALNGRSISRSTVGGIFWPEASEEHAHASLRSALSRLTLVAHDAIVVSAHDLRLAEHVAVDIRQTRALAHRLISADGPAQAGDLSELSIAALSADLLPDWYDDWALIAAEDWRQLRLHALDALTARLTAVKRYADAAGAALAAVQAEPLRESSHAALISVYVAEGNRAEARAAFERYRSMLHTDLGLEPTARLQALVADL